MSHLQTIPNAFVFTFILATALVGWSRFPDGTAELAPALMETKTVEYLETTGQYESLGKAIANARYAVRDDSATAGARAAAENPRQGLSSRFDETGLRLSVRTAEKTTYTTRWRLEKLGYGDRHQSVPVGELRRDGRRAEIVRSELGITEWFVNSPAGLEHGFTLTDRPVNRVRPDQPLTLTLAISGDLEAQAIREGQAIELRDPHSGRTVLNYDKLEVWDADGRPVTARMNTEGNSVIFEVDDADARYPLTIDPLFTQQQYLKASDAEGNATQTHLADQFGTSVGISGNYAVVGALKADGTNGAAYVFERDPVTGTWTEEQILGPSVTSGFPEFGTSVAIDGDTIVVGAPQEEQIAPDPYIKDAGAVYVFVRNPITENWDEQARLTASNRGWDDEFGTAVAVDEDTVVAGVHREDGDASSTQATPNDSAPDAGAAYVFIRNGITWTQQAYLKASNADQNDFLGISVAISGDTVVAGASGEDSDGSGEADNSANSPGAAYVFERNPVSLVWTQTDYLKASNVDSLDHFGTAVAASGDTVVAGSPGEDGDTSSTMATPNNNKESAGAAYVFVRDPVTGNWPQQAYLKTFAANVSIQDLGNAVALEGDTVLIGALDEPGDVSSTMETPNHNAPNAGAAYVFTRSGTAWTLRDYLKASNAESHDHFGFSVALSGDNVLIGAPEEDGDASSTAAAPNNDAGNAGAAYLFTLIQPQPDNIIGPLGDDLYNMTGAGQTQRLVSKRARKVRTVLTIQNDGNITEPIKLLGTRGNSTFRITYTSAGANVTGAVIGGTFMTPPLAPGDTHAVNVEAKPNKRKVLKKVRRGKRRINVWLKKRLTLKLTSSSNTDGAKKDVAGVKVQHK